MLVPLLTLVVAAVAWLSWRGSASLRGSLRGLLTGLRTTAALGVSLLLLNPGEWVRPKSSQESPWLVMLDRSASMAQPLGSATRRDSAVEIAGAIAESLPDGTPVRYVGFDSAPGEPLDSPADLPPADGQGSDLIGSLERLTSEAAAGGIRHAGVIVLSDGRQTAEVRDSALEALSLRLRSRATPLFAVAVGAGDTLRDLVLRAPRPTITVFTGQTVKIPFELELSGLEPRRATVVLADEQGNELAQTAIDLTAGEPVFGHFEVAAPEAGARWSLRTEVMPGEVRHGNNRAAVNIRLLHSRTRVFLAEGAPYWDSKFLAQLLRQQSHMEVHSVHRLSENRYFRIDSGENDAAETDTAIFPDTLDELSAYDLVIFGKNVDAFLTPTRLDALRAYVRDRGGAVLFARGKPTTSAMPVLEALEPVTWAAGSIDEFHFHPSEDGRASGLFGEVLPPPEASVWSQLPPLKDARTVSFVKPFTRILAEGAEGAAFSGKTPALLVRRYGQGVCGLVNGDGLWKWDFYPEARELGNMYEDFWTQLIQWMASYSEFLPGQDFSLRLPASAGAIDQPVTATLSYRGGGTPPPPGVTITAPDGRTRRLQPGAVPDPGGHPTWRASFTPDAPGAWNLRVEDSREDAPPTPELTFRVPSPREENDDLSPDPAFLGRLADGTGGRLLEAGQVAGFLDDFLKPTPPTSRSQGAVWESSWAAWPVALLLALLLAAEWYLRRRQGLA
ncbi:hypothetical protein Hsar01_00293 [Haloferula sargassicola]|uniref:Glutamine amidotransferase domain-containing protein n=1 Tax=Haloferula sargassicola TaxID=490096 RepID=A0ABP9UKA7_9BACT